LKYFCDSAYGGNGQIKETIRFEKKNSEYKHFAGLLYDSYKDRDGMRSCGFIEAFIALS
jgi:hypothetical protein